MFCTALQYTTGTVFIRDYYCVHNYPFIYISIGIIKCQNICVLYKLIFKTFYINININLYFIELPETLQHFRTGSHEYFIFIKGSYNFSTGIK